nr:immunoglobulin light chain junction region [Mus musculus]NSL97926.1 immunoglobulin light chain junction region [Mus musculus]NSL97971.1 immunoglobulin light chain junction region [Mus musculus]NSL98432.1 immunoglobulin light chain junction region [Mus musculus]NSL98548.1 immunoglobulin light chain junction region [Mus musculus]
CQQSSSWPLTF